MWFHYRRTGTWHRLSSLKEPTPGNDALASGGIKKDIDKAGAAKDAGADVNAGQSPFFAGELGKAGN